MNFHHIWQTPPSQDVSLNGISRLIILFLLLLIQIPAILAAHSMRLSKQRMLQEKIGGGFMEMSNPGFEPELY
jgi:hypothetical protein